MFTIQYFDLNGKSSMQEFDAKARSRLVMYLAKFDRPIIALYEQATPITKAIRAELASIPRDRLSREAREFVDHGDALARMPKFPA